MEISEQIEDFVKASYQVRKQKKGFIISRKSNAEQVNTARIVLDLEQKGIKASQKQVLLILKALATPEPESEESETNEFLITRVQKYLGNKYDFRYNEIANTIECRLKSQTEYKEINENDIFIELLEIGFQIGQSLLIALLRSSFVVHYNPFVNYFESLPKWSKEKPDYIELLANYVKTTEQERFVRYFKKALVRSVACSIEQGKANKHAIILFGGQHNGKSHFIRFLCPRGLENYMTDSFSFDKDGEITLASNFLINLDDMDRLNNQNLNYIKTIIQKPYINVRRPFEKKPSRAKRTANFFGTTNKHDILTDETGNVRWLCFEVLGMDWKGYTQNIDIDTVYSQAYSLYKEGFYYELTKDEVLENEAANAQFRQASTEMELIIKHLEPANKESHEYFWTATDIYKHLLKVSEGVKINANQVGKALTALKFPKGQEYLGKSYQTKGYYVNLIQDPEAYAQSYKVRTSKIKDVLLADVINLVDGQYFLDNLFTSFCDKMTEYSI